MISIIDSYEKLPIGLYLQLCDAEENQTEDLDKAVTRIAILTGLTEREVLNLDLNTFSDLNQKAKFVERDAPITRVKDQYEVSGYIIFLSSDVSPRALLPIPSSVSATSVLFYVRDFP